MSEDMFGSNMSEDIFGSNMSEDIFGSNLSEDIRRTAKTCTRAPLETMLRENYSKITGQLLENTSENAKHLRFLAPK